MRLLDYWGPSRLASPGPGCAGSSWEKPGPSTQRVDADWCSVLSPLLSHDQKPPTRASALRTHPDVAGTTLSLQMWRRPPRADRGGIGYSRVEVLVEASCRWACELDWRKRRVRGAGEPLRPGVPAAPWSADRDAQGTGWAARCWLLRDRGRRARRARAACVRACMQSACVQSACVRGLARAHPGGSSAHPRPGSVPTSPR